MSDPEKRVKRTAVILSGADLIRWLHARAKSQHRLLANLVIHELEMLKQTEEAKQAETGKSTTVIKNDSPPATVYPAKLGRPSSLNEISSKPNAVNVVNKSKG